MVSQWMHLFRGILVSFARYRSLEGKMGETKKIRFKFFCVAEFQADVEIGIDRIPRLLRTKKKNSTKKYDGNG